MISFSRHARRRMRLYGIDAVDVEIALATWKGKTVSPVGRLSIVSSSPAGTRYPLRIVFEMKGQDIEVVTVYPLKKGVKR